MRPSIDDAGTRSESVTEQLRAALLDGRFDALARLNEVHLSRELGVSRTPVRAALQTLAGEGLLTYQPNRGFLVRGFALADIIDAYEMRALAEGLAARLAAERGLSASAQLTLSEVLSQGDALLRSEESATAGRAVYARVNEDFHTTIHAAAGTGLVLDVIRLCQRVPQSSTHNVVAFEFDDVRSRHEAHHRIFEAIVMREPRQAETLMRQHVLSVKTSLIRSYTAARRAASAAAE